MFLKERVFDFPHGCDARAPVGWELEGGGSWTLALLHTGLAASACSALFKVELPQDQLATLTGRIQEAGTEVVKAKARSR